MAENAIGFDRAKAKRLELILNAMLKLLRNQLNAFGSIKADLRKDARELLTLLSAALESGMCDARNPHPRSLPGGEPNRAHYLWEYQRVKKMANQSVKIKGVFPAHAKAQMDMIEREAKGLGLDMAKMGEEQSNLLSDPKLLDFNDKEIKAFEALISEMEVEHSRAEWRVAAYLRRKKKWLKLVKKVMELRGRARKSPLMAFSYIARTEKDELFTWDPLHFDIERHVIDCVRKSKHYLLQVHPGAFKTMLLTGIMSVFLMENPNLRLAVIRHNQPEAAKIARFMRTLLAHPRARALYPKCQINRHRGKGDTTYLKRDSESIDPTVGAYGILSSGEGVHCDIMFMDDPCPARIEDEPSTRERIKNRFWKTWTKRLVEGAVCIIDGYSFSTTDLYQEIIKKSKAGTFDCHLDIFPAGGSPDFTAPAPSAFNSSSLKMIHDTRPSDYSWFYQLRPMDDSNRIVMRLHYYKVGGIIPPFQKVVISVDPAASAGKGANATGIGVWGIPVKGAAHLLAADRIRAAPEYIMPIFDSWVEKWKPTDILMEAVIGFRYLCVMMQERYPNVKLTRYTAESKSKSTRLKNAERYIRHSYLLFPSRDGYNIVDDLVWLADQLIYFEAGAKEDDGVDMVSQVAKVYKGHFGAIDRYRDAKPRILSTDELFLRDEVNFVENAVAAGQSGRYDETAWMQMGHEN
jgi:hypothetical protein